MKVGIIKLSGKVLNSFLSNEKWTKKIRELYGYFDKLFIVHGGGKQISEWMTVFEINPQFINGQRVTCKKTIEIVSAVQIGLINTQIVNHLNKSGINTIGYSGVDNSLIKAKTVSSDLGFVGIPYKANINFLDKIIKDKSITVFSTLCPDHDGNLLNVNADIFTDFLASQVNADYIFYISDIDGVVLDNEVKKRLCASDFISGLKNGKITEGMIPKLQSSFKMLRKGIKNIWIGKNIDFIEVNNNEIEINGGTKIVN